MKQPKANEPIKKQASRESLNLEGDSSISEEEDSSRKHLNKLLFDEDSSRSPNQVRLKSNSNSPLGKPKM